MKQRENKYETRKLQKSVPDMCHVKQKQQQLYLLHHQLCLGYEFLYLHIIIIVRCSIFPFDFHVMNLN